jgi:probable F420-dependent oxidoreductase
LTQPNRARQILGRVGVWVPELNLLSAQSSIAAVQALEDIGYSTVWLGEALGKDVFSNASILLSASQRITVAIGIASIWARDAVAMGAAERTVAEAFPHRWVLGLGVSHAASVERIRGHAYRHPLRAMSDYLDRLDAAPLQSAAPEVASPRILAALGPRMLQLAAARTAGAHPFLVSVDHTRWARGLIGSQPVLAPEQAVILETGADRARTVARSHLRGFLRLPNYRANLTRMGYLGADLENDGSDGLIDDLVAWGSVDAVVERVNAHLEAGADHVAVRIISSDVSRVPLDEARQLAPALLSL